MRLRLKLEDYVPKIEGVEKIVDEKAGIEAYKWTAEVRGVMRPFYMVFIGKSDKPAERYYARSTEERDRAVQRAIDAGLRRAADKERRASERRIARQIGHGLQVGDLLQGSWGYDQTNQEVYTIVEVRGWDVLIQGVVCDRQETGFMSYKLKPSQDRRTHGPVLRKRVSVHSWGTFVKLHDSCSLQKSSWEAEFHETCYA